MANRSSSKMSRQEAGRKGAEARWGQESNEKRGNSRVCHQNRSQIKIDESINSKTQAIMTTTMLLND